MDNEGVKGCLLHDSGDSDVRDAEKNRVHNDEGLGGGVSHSEQCGIH